MTLLMAESLEIALQGLDPTLRQLDWLDPSHFALDPRLAAYPGGTVYLVHMLVPYVAVTGKRLKSFQHYIGHAEPDCLVSRLQEHGTPAGSRCLQVAAAAGIDWILARTWEGGYDRERRIKAQGSARRFCPACGVRPHHMS